jgi:hypothetical protein
MAKEKTHPKKARKANKLHAKRISKKLKMYKAKKK